MLGRVLRAEAHPFALVSIAGADANRYLDVAITLNGVTRNIRIPAKIETNTAELWIGEVSASTKPISASRHGRSSAAQFRCKTA